MWGGHEAVTLPRPTCRALMVLRGLLAHVDRLLSFGPRMCTGLGRALGTALAHCDGNCVQNAQKGLWSWRAGACSGTWDVGSTRQPR